VLLRGYTGRETDTGGSEMAGIQTFATHVSDYAERVARMADAAEGKQPRRKGRVRSWLLLPAAGATIYAVVRSDFFARQAKEAKTRASELPEDLVARVRETTETPSTANGDTAKKTTRRGSTRRASGTRRPRSTGKARTPSR
jgi:hypothetical protein